MISQNCLHRIKLDKLTFQMTKNESGAINGARLVGWQTSQLDMSFMGGIFPEYFKIGQITLLLKKPGADTKVPVSYRPIADLSTMSTILERLANKQLQEHFPFSLNFNTYQSPFRSFHSTETGMTKVVNDLLTAVDSGKLSIILSLDVSAGFSMLFGSHSSAQESRWSLRTHRPSLKLAYTSLTAPTMSPLETTGEQQDSALLDFYNTSRSTNHRLQYIISSVRWW